MNIHNFFSGSIFTIECRGVNPSIFYRYSHEYEGGQESHYLYKLPLGEKKKINLISQGGSFVGFALVDDSFGIEMRSKLISFEDLEIAKQL